MAYILRDESGNALSDESSNSLLDDYVPVSLDAGAFSVSGQTLTVLGVATNSLRDDANGDLLDDSGLVLGDESTVGSSIAAAKGTFSLTGYTTSLTLSGLETDIPLNRGTFSLSGWPLGIGSGLGDLDGSLDTAPDPDEINYVFENPFNGTIYWVVTASATPPGLQGTPAGFVSSGLASGSFPVTTSGGSDTIDLSAVNTGNYYIHVVGQRSSDGAFTTVDSDAIVIEGTLDRGTFAIVGYSVSVPRLSRLPRGTFTYSGYPASINDSPVSLNAGSLSITGFSMAVDSTAPLDAGSFSYSGSPVAISSLSRLDAGLFSVTGFGVTMEGSVADTLLPGAFTMTGRSLTVAANTNAELGSGNYTLTGRDMTLVPGGPVTLVAGEFVISGYGITATITDVADPNFATPQNSLRGGVLVSSRRAGILGVSERRGVLPQSARSGIVTRGS